ncbi:THO complex subunit 6 homolog [Coccinella septempunctata]|uniref:THO complex subunit 6 homolog n=1 Tax=Coccinella septempunctata TaxID=41139 RepID=UPI001D080BB2|nr:THO complex subunit 6 homolog [Coccinella septempunctata]
MGRSHKSDHHYHDGDKDHYVKYRSIVSSISFDIDKSDLNLTTKNKWTHVGENILRLPAIRKKFSLVSKVTIAGRDCGIHSVAISPKGRVVAIGLDTGEVQLRRLSVITQSDISICLRKPKKGTHMNTAVTCVRFMPNMENVLLSSDLSGHIDMIHTDKKCKHTLAKEHDNQINSIDVNSAATRIVSGGKDALLRVYDAYTGKIVSSTEPFWKRNFDCDDSKYHKFRIYCIKFDPENSNIFFSGGLDGYVKMWDLREPSKSVRTMRGPYIRGDAMDLWGNVLLTGSWRVSKSMDLWDTTSGQLIENLVPSNRASSLDGEFYECVRFFNGGKDGSVILCGGGGTGRFEVYNLLERRMDFGVIVQDTVKTIDSTLSSIVCAGLDGICRVVRYNRIEDKE